MNLHVNFDGEPFGLTQTPTWLTYACLIDHEGKVSTTKGEEAKRSLYVYLQWFGQEYDSSIHENDLINKMQTSKEIEVYYL